MEVVETFREVERPVAAYSIQSGNSMPGGSVEHSILSLPSLQLDWSNNVAQQGGIIRPRPHVSLNVNALAQQSYTKIFTIATFTSIEKSQDN